MPRFKVKGKKKISRNPIKRQITRKSQIFSNSDEDAVIEELNKKRKATSDPVDHRYDSDDSVNNELWIVKDFVWRIVIGDPILKLEKVQGNEEGERRMKGFTVYEV